MKRTRIIVVALALVLLLGINMVLLTACGNRYYYDELFDHVRHQGKKEGESFRITETMKSESGDDLTFELYVNKTYDHFIAISVDNTTNKHALQLSLDGQLSGKYSLIPKLRDVDLNGDQYIMCDYNPLTEKMSILDDSTHIIAENKETCMAVVDELLPILLTRFKAYIIEHSTEMHDIKLWHLGFEPRPVEPPAPNTDNTDNTDSTVTEQN